MKKVILGILLIPFQGNSAFGQSLINSIEITIGKELTIKSEVLNREQHVLIHCPNNFDSEKQYPMIVLLDFMAFNSLSSITETMGYNKTIENCIVVCPVFKDIREEYSPINKSTNELGSGIRTMQYLEVELLPYIESKYRISKKILWGQNYSGMFSTFVMLQKPHLFDAYFSDLPKLEVIQELLERDNVFGNIENQEIYYYISSSSLIKEKKDLDNFLDMLKSSAPSNMKWFYLEQSDTISIAHISSNFIYALCGFLGKTANQ